MREVILCVFFTVTVCTAQHTAPITGADILEDVVDHSRFDSLWRESKRFGKLDTRGVLSEAYKSYRDSLAKAYPDRCLPESRLAFWVNAYLTLLMETMNQRVGYRATVWDSLYLQRDTATVAGAPFTLQQLVDTIVGTARMVAVRAFLCTGSSTGPPFPAHALYARTVRTELRDQLRKLVRSERYVLFDPAGNVLQLAMMFKPWLPEMTEESGGVVEFLLPWMTEAMAAQVALVKSSIHIQFSDRVETWKKTR